MKILAIQPLGGKLHAIMNEGDPIPIDKIGGNPSPGRLVTHDGIGYVVASAAEEACEV